MTPEEEEQVRRALAATARAEDESTSPGMPPDVANRLDGVLAELVGARSTRDTAPSVPPGDELAARRARRWPNVLVAAAAVAVIAAAGGAVAIRGLGGDSANDSSASSDAAAGDAYQDDKAAPEAGTAPSPTDGDTGSRALAALPVPRLRSSSLAADVQAVEDAGPVGDLASGAEAPDASAGRVGCVIPPAPRGADVVAVRLDGRRATLVLGPPHSGTREARVYSCADGGTPVARTTVEDR